MDNTELENKIKTLTNIMVFGFLITFILLIGLYFKGGSEPEKTNTTTPTSSTATDSSTTKTYDTSKLTLLDKEKTSELVKSKGTKFIFIGRSGCGVCKALLPNLNQVIEDLDLEMYYLSLDVDNWRDEYGDIFDHLKIETTIKSGSGSYSGTYGELLNKHGFTPMLIVLKDGEMVEGLVGNKSVSTLTTFYKKYI